MKIKELEFRKFIGAEKIQESVLRLAGQINEDYQGKTPVFLPILNGSFFFAADLIKEIRIPCRISCVKFSPYQGATQSSGQLKTLIGLDESLFNQDIIIVDGMIVSGQALQKILAELRGLGTKSVEVVSLLRKKIAREKNAEAKYVGFDLDDEFVVGYGLDYDGLGRNYKDIYKRVD